MVMRRADTSRRVVDVADRHLPAVHVHIGQIVLNTGGRGAFWLWWGLRLCVTTRRDQCAKSANKATASLRVTIMVAP